jgi:hypothetical protein
MAEEHVLEVVQGQNMLAARTLGHNMPARIVMFNVG